MARGWNMATLIMKVRMRRDMEEEEIRKSREAHMHQGLPHKPHHLKVDLQCLFDSIVTFSRQPFYPSNKEPHPLQA